MAKSFMQGFKVLPIKYSTNCNNQHELFIKENSVRAHSIDKPLGRTLFVLNVPPYITEANLKELFGAAGKVQSVKLETKNGNAIDKLSGFKVSYVVFKEMAGLANALKLNNLPPLGSPLTGVKKWSNHYNGKIDDHRMLQKTVDSFMGKYDKQVEQQRREESKAVTDSEGWTVVTKCGRNSGLPRKINNVANDEVSYKKKKQLRNFYTFQIREAKMKKLAMLRKKYDEDKKKIDTMKQARKFKPF